MRVDRGLADRHPADLGALAEHGDEPAVEVAVGDAQPAALGDAQPGAVEHLEHGDVAQHDRDRRRVVVVVGATVVGVGDVVEQVVGLVGADHAWQAADAPFGARRSAPGSWSITPWRRR